MKCFVEFIVSPPPPYLIYCREGGPTADYSYRLTTDEYAPLSLQTKADGFQPCYNPPRHKIIGWSMRGGRRTTTHEKANTLILDITQTHEWNSQFYHPMNLIRDVNLPLSTSTQRTPFTNAKPREFYHSTSIELDVIVNIKDGHPPQWRQSDSTTLKNNEY